MKIGIDFHGVIEEYPEFFSEFTQAMIAFNHEIHIITGSKEKDISAFLFEHKIGYTHFYSITDDLLNENNWYKRDSNDNLIFNDYKWNTAKALYCNKNDITLMFDDSDIYSKYFNTAYCKWEKIK